MIPAIAISYFALAGLLLWLVTGTPGRWRLKLAAIAAVLAYGFLLWDALDSYTGWATTSRPPAEAVFVAGSVREPDAGDPGAIFLWLAETPADRNPLARHGSPEPRAYRLPYTRQAHEQLAKAQQLAKRDGGARLQFGRPTGPRLPRSAFRAYPLPAAQLPAKTT